MSSDAGQTSAVRTIGRYRAFDELGRGAMGVVYRGFDPVIGRTVALKTLLLDSADAQAREFRERLYREAAAAGALSHPNIVTIFDIVEEGNLTAIAMEFIEGQSLAAIIRDQGPLRLDVALEYFEQVCSALDFAGGHGIIHRDIKPPNILVTAAGRVKITDFGVARLAMSTMTQAGTVLGSPSYMSPEQVRGLALDPRSDLFSAAVVFYEMITRERPFAGSDVATTMYRIAHEPPTPPNQFNAAVGPELTAVLERALAKNPDHRYPTGAQLADELRRVIISAPASPIVVSPVLPVAVAAPPAPADRSPGASVLGGTLPPIPTGAAVPAIQSGGTEFMPLGVEAPPVIPPLAAPPARASSSRRRWLLAGVGGAVVVVAVVAGAVAYFLRPASTGLDVQPSAVEVPAATAAPPAAVPAAPESPPPAAAAAPQSGLLPPPAAVTPRGDAGRPSGQPATTPARPSRRPPPSAGPGGAPPTPAQGASPAQPERPGSDATRGTGRVYSATEVDERPQVLQQVEPAYPERASRRGLEDVVVLRVLVSADGRAEEVQVLRGSVKDAEFDTAAVAAVQQWTFRPARKGGQAVAAWYSVGVPFQLKR